MNYNEPKDVITPQTAVTNLYPIFDGGPWDYSLALMDWEGEPALGIRWNGGTEAKSVGKQKIHPGNPQSRGYSTWFIVPKPFVIPILKKALSQGLGGGSINKKQAEKFVRDKIENLTA